MEKGLLDSGEFGGFSVEIWKKVAFFPLLHIKNSKFVWIFFDKHRLFLWIF